MDKIGRTSSQISNTMVGVPLLVFLSVLGAAVTGNIKDTQPDNLQGTVKELDTDGNGELSREEVQKGLEELAKAKKLRSEIK